MRWLLAICLCVPVPAAAEWAAANPEVEAAARTPKVAAVLREVTAIDAAIVAGDKQGFISRFGAGAVVNSPFNNVSTAEVAAQRFTNGVINYRYLRRSIEYAALRGKDEVVLMGEEAYEPREGAPMAGKTVRRRFTDIWRWEKGAWKLSVRQATIFEIR